MHFIGATVTERLGWDRVLLVNDRKAAWVFSVRASGMYIIPKSAVRPDQLEAFTRQLMDWAGKKYKICNT